MSNRPPFGCVAAATVMLAACADLPSASPTTGPALHYSTRRVGDSDYVSFSTEQAARSAFPLPQIYAFSPVVYWDGGVAVGSSTLQYFGNRATQELKVEAASGGRTSTTTGITSDSHILPDVYEFTHPGISTSPGQQTCGGTANLSAKYSAWIVVFVEIKGLLTFDPALRSGTDVRYQPSCPPEPCPTINADAVNAPVRLASTGGTLCYEDGNLGGGGGGGGDCPDCVNTPAGPTYCRVRYWYWKDTGEIFASQILWCA